MRDEKEERKKQARSNKQTRQSNTAHPRQSLFFCTGDRHINCTWVSCRAMFRENVECGHCSVLPVVELTV